jgi:hypothetical protein
MSKRREEKDDKKLDEEIDESLSFKHWITRMIMVGIFLLFIVYIFESTIKQPMLVDTMIAITIVLFIGFLHESLHYYVAIKLGYKPKWFRTKIRMGFTIDHKRSGVAPGRWPENKKKIAMLPYYVIIPLSILLIVVGFYLDFIGIWVAGIGSILLHIMSYPGEGKDK